MSDIQVLTFVCNWCSYLGADKAGGKRLDIPPGVRLVRVMCSGRIDSQIILRSFHLGADGVLVLGCHPGECHYKRGNFAAQKQTAFLRALLPALHIDPERLRLDWVSANDGERFARVVNEMFGKVAALGKLRARPASPGEAHP